MLGLQFVLQNTVHDYVIVIVMRLRSEPEEGGLKRSVVFIMSNWMHHAVNRHRSVTLSSEVGLFFLKTWPWRYSSTQRQTMNVCSHLYLSAAENTPLRGGTTGLNVVSKWKVLPLRIRLVTGPSLSRARRVASVSIALQVQFVFIDCEENICRLGRRRTSHDEELNVFFFSLSWS